MLIGFYLSNCYIYRFFENGKSCIYIVILLFVYMLTFFEVYTLFDAVYKMRDKTFK